MATKRTPQNPKGAGVKAHGLTDQQIRFCEEYAKTLHVGQSYENAGYKCNSRAARDASASTLLKHPNVQQYLAEVAGLSPVAVVSAVTAI
ncbi:MAG: terminase small subunit, partial [Xenococcaceae cyanobacterium]